MFKHTKIETYWRGSIPRHVVCDLQGVALSQQFKTLKGAKLFQVQLEILMEAASREN